MIRVMIIDDSALVRNLLKSILDEAPDIEVVGVAADPYFARDKFKKLKPDVITLDVEMPRMDGLTFLQKLMSFSPTPVVMISSLTQKGAETTIKALSLGAVDFVAKPQNHLEKNLAVLADDVISKVRAAAQANITNNKRKKIDPIENLSSTKKILIDQVLTKKGLGGNGQSTVICIGASTGGTVATEQILRSLPGAMPGIVIVQHMPQGFTKAFADRLNTICAMEVVEAKSMMDVEPGKAIVAQGGKHLLLQQSKGSYYVEIKDGPPVNRHKPSVDVLFRSAANSVGKNALGVILTGMGDDGAKGLRDLHDTGAFTIAQDEKSCVVFGMPKVAIDLGAATKVSSLDYIPSLLIQRVKQESNS